MDLQDIFELIFVEKQEEAIDDLQYIELVGTCYNLLDMNNHLEKDIKGSCYVSDNIVVFDKFIFAFDALL